MLAVEFKVAWDQAEEMKLMPVRQTHVHQLYRCLQKPLRELHQEVERSVEASRRDGGMSPASALFLSGGATQLHGFYRAMQAGPETLAVTTVDRASQSGMETFRDE